MVKILIIGEAHNSALAPKVVLESLKILRRNEVEIIAASEDEAGLQAPIDLFQYVEKMNLLKGEQEKVIKSLPNLYFLSAQEDKAKYFAELEKFIGIKSPDSVPKPAAAEALAFHDKVATL